MDRKTAKKLAKDSLPNKRFEHCVAVANLAATLAEQYGVDVEAAYLAGMLHDLSKGMPADKQLQLACQAVPPIDEHFRNIRALWHGPASTVLLREHGIDNEELLDAIYYHTSAKPNMSTLAKIVYLSDYLEPHRSFDGIEDCREVVTRDLDEAMIMALENTIRFLNSKEYEIHPLAFDALEYYKQQVVEKA